MRVAVIGCGLVGQKRANALAGSRLVACADILPERAQALARMSPHAKAEVDWRNVISRSEVDVVIVSTPHHLLTEIALECVHAGKHVLLEKPAAVRAADLDRLIRAAQETGVLVRVGFNHRYHRALRTARDIANSGALGELLYVRGRYGHGGRLGYEKEWRANPELAGGGELIDQGIHLIDLARWFLGDFTQIEGFAHTYYWNMPVEDNGFMLLKTPQRQVAFLHASCTEWKNLFSFEIFGRKGKLEISGLGGSYGVERLAFYKMLPEMGPPETTIWEYPSPDNSWELEFSEFLDDICLKRTPSAGLSDAQAALQIVEQVYQASKRCE
jgi:predicted dehydrogenase